MHQFCSEKFSTAPVEQQVSTKEEIPLPTRCPVCARTLGDTLRSTSSEYQRMSAIVYESGSLFPVRAERGVGGGDSGDVGGIAAGVLEGVVVAETPAESNPSEVSSVCAPMAAGSEVATTTVRSRRRRLTRSTT